VLNWSKIQSIIQYVLHYTSDLGSHLVAGLLPRLRLMALASLVVLFPISQPHPLKIFTTFGVMAAVRGTLMKMNDLWIAYANASCVAKPAIPSVGAHCSSKDDMIRK
jgi:hypothetical protein